MKGLSVSIEEPAWFDLEEAYSHIAADSRMAAERWYKSALQAIYTLEDFPERCPLALENELFQEEIRHLIHGAYRILFTVRENVVHVLHVRHGSRDVMIPDEFE